MAKNNNLLEFSDQELRNKIIEDSKYLGIVYEKYKVSSISFLKTKSSGLRHLELDDIFSESCMELYKNFAFKDKPLESSLQTYLNSICLNQLRSVQNKELDSDGNIKVKKKPLSDEDKKNYNEKIEKDEILASRNSNNKPVNPDWLPDAAPEDEDFTNVIKKNAIKAALRKMKADGGHCAELLVLFWWRKRSMRELMEIYGYKNERTTIQQKARCQKRIKILMQKEV